MSETAELSNDYIISCNQDFTGDMKTEVSRISRKVRKTVAKNLRNPKSSYNFFDKLPTNLYYCLRDFLSSVEMLFLLNASKQFSEAKQQTMLYQLNAIHSERYLTNDTFREQVISRILNPSTQLSLQINNFSCVGKCPERFLPLSLKMTLILNSCLSNVTLTRNPLHFRRNQDALDGFSFIQLTETVRPRQRGFFNGLLITIDEEKEKQKTLPQSKYDILLRSPVHSYYFDSFYIGFNDNLSDVRPFSFTRSLILQQCAALSDVSALSDVHRLELIECDEVSDVSPLSGVRHLSLISCGGIKDISSLKRNHSLVIENCQHVSDFSCLQHTSITRLKLQHSEPIKQLPLPSSLQEVELKRFQGKVIVTYSDSDSNAKDSDSHSHPSPHRHNSLRKLSLISCPVRITPLILLSLHTIKLTNCNDNLTTLPPGFGQVHTVILDTCNDLTSLEGLGGENSNNVLIDIRNCPNVSDFSPLRRVHTVRISSCRRFKRCEEVSEVEDLTIHDSFALDRINSLIAVKRLTLSQCYRLTRIEAVQDNDEKESVIEALTLTDCDEFLPSLSLIALKRCNKVEVNVAGNHSEEVFRLFDDALAVNPSSLSHGSHRIFDSKESQRVYLKNTN